MVIPGVALASGQLVNAVPAIEIEPSEPVALLSAEGDDGVPSSGLGEETLARANATTLVVSLVGRRRRRLVFFDVISTTFKTSNEWPPVVILVVTDANTLVLFVHPLPKVLS